MTSSLRLQCKMHQTLCQHLPQELNKPQRDNLSWVIAGLHEAEHVHLSKKIASERVGAAQLESKTKQVRRFLANEATGPAALLRASREASFEGSRLFRWAYSPAG